MVTCSFSRWSRTVARRSAGAACTVVVSAGALIALSGPAGAHVSVDPSTTEAGAQAVVEVSFAHGCEGSPTTRIQVQIPEGINAVAPTRHPAWQVEKEVVALDPPVSDGHGNQLTERVASVTYTADEPVPDGYRDVLELGLQLPETAGETLTFPTVQTCEQGESAWIEVAADDQDSESLELPAPGFEVTPAGTGSGHDDTTTSGASDPVRAADAGSTAGASTDAATEPGGDGVLGVAALAAGLLGVVLGGAALVRQRRGA